MNDFVGHSGIQKMGDWGGVVQYGPGDSGMVVLFFLKPVHNAARSVEQGSPQFDDKVFVRIHPPGERLNIIEREANDSDKRRFPMQWNQFKENAPQTANGIPIDLLFPAKPSIAAALKASGVFTIEQCADLSAHAIETIGMGAQQWCNDAVRYMEVANKGVKASQLKAALEERDRTIHSQKHKIERLEAELANIRDRVSQTVTMEDVQQMIGNVGGKQGKRPQFAPGRQQPQSFDAAAAQIAAVHPTNFMITKPAAKKAPVKEAAPTKRARAKLV